MRRRSAVLDAIDERLRMLDANAERERLRLEADARFDEHREDVGGRMARGEHDEFGGELFTGREPHAGSAAALVKDESHDARSEPERDAHPLELRPEARDDL